MYRVFRKPGENKNSSASTDYSEDGFADEPKEKLFFFDAVPDSRGISPRDMANKISQMDLISLRQEYRRLMKVSDINEELILDRMERLEAQDRIAEAEMTTSEAVQTINDNWTKKLTGTKIRHKNYQDEASRIKQEHLKCQADSQMFEERNETFKPEIREIVNEIEELQNRRDAFKETVGYDIGALTVKTEALVSESEKSYELLASLRKELNDLKIGLLAEVDDENGDYESISNEVIDGDEEGYSEEAPTPFKYDNVDIDRIGVENHVPQISTSRLMNQDVKIPIDNFHGHNNGNHIQIWMKDKDQTEVGDSNNVGVKSETHVLRVNVSTSYTQQRSSSRSIQVCQQKMLHRRSHVSGCGIQINSWINKNDSVGSTPCDFDNSVHKDTTRRPRLEKLISANYTSKSEKCIVQTNVNGTSLQRIHVLPNSVKQNYGRLKHESFDVRPKTGPPKCIVPTPPKSETSGSNTTRYISSPLASSTTYIATPNRQMRPPRPPRPDQSRKARTHHRPDLTIDNTTQMQSITVKQLPSISQGKQTNKKRLKMNPVSVESALPSVSPRKTNVDNGVICEVLVSSPRPMYTSKMDAVCNTKPPPNESANTGVPIPKTKAPEAEEKPLKSLNKIKLVGNKKLLNRRGYDT